MHVYESAEDYLEAILVITKRRGLVRSIFFYCNIIYITIYCDRIIFHLNLPPHTLFSIYQRALLRSALRIERTTNPSVEVPS